VFLAGRAVAANKAFSAGTHAVVAGLDAVLFGHGIGLRLGSDGNVAREGDRGHDGKKSDEPIHGVFLNRVVMGTNLPDWHDVLAAEVTRVHSDDSRAVIQSTDHACAGWRIAAAVFCALSQ
jgi:hypothetical protein